MVAREANLICEEAWNDDSMRIVQVMPSSDARFVLLRDSLTFINSSDSNRPRLAFAFSTNGFVSNFSSFSLGIQWRHQRVKMIVVDLKEFLENEINSTRDKSLFFERFDKIKRHETCTQTFASMSKRHQSELNTSQPASQHRSRGKNCLKWHKKYFFFRSHSDEDWMI